MIDTLLKSIVVLGFYVSGLGAVVGIWDYTRQAKEANYVYSLDAYKVSVMDRYGAEAAIAFKVIDIAKAGAVKGLDYAEKSGMLAQLGLTLPELLKQPAETDPGVAGQPASMIVFASAASPYAPESSLYPRARVLR